MQYSIFGTSTIPWKSKSFDTSVYYDFLPFYPVKEELGMRGAKRQSFKDFL